MLLTKLFKLRLLTCLKLLKLLTVKLINLIFYALIYNGQIFEININIFQIMKKKQLDLNEIVSRQLLKGPQLKLICLLVMQTKIQIILK